MGGERGILLQSFFAGGKTETHSHYVLRHLTTTLHHLCLICGIFWCVHVPAGWWQPSSGCRRGESRQSSAFGPCFPLLERPSHLCGLLPPPRPPSCQPPQELESPWGYRQSTRISSTRLSKRPAMMRATEGAAEDSRLSQAGQGWARAMGSPGHPCPPACLVC